MNVVQAALTGCVCFGVIGGTAVQEPTKETVRPANPQSAPAIIEPVPARPPKQGIVVPVRASAKPTTMLVTDSADGQGRIAVIVGDGRFADLLIMPTTRIERGKGSVPASAIVSGTRLSVWGKWDATRPEIYRAYSIQVGARLPEIEVRREIERACANVARRRTVPGSE